MATHDNAPPLPDWQPEPHPNPFDFHFGPPRRDETVTIPDSIELGEN